MQTRHADDVTLGHVDPAFVEGTQHGHILDTLGNGFLAGGFGNRGQSGDDGAIEVVIRQPLDQRAVDLQNIGLDLLEVGKGREAGAEIIDGDTASERTQRSQLCLRILDVVDRM